MLSARLCVLLFLTVSPVFPRRASVGSPSRGGSASRGQVGGGSHNTNQGGGYHPQTNNNYHPQPQPNNFNNQGFRGNNNNFNNQRPYYPPQSGGFHPGSGYGSASSGNTFRNAVIGGALGAAGGLIAFEAGKAIINSATTPFHHDNRNYYWDNNYQPQANQITCSISLAELQRLSAADTTTAAPTTTTTVTAGTAGLESTTPNTATTTPSVATVLNTIQYKDGTRPKQVTWGCRRGAEVCCGTDCCPVQAQQFTNNGVQPGSAGLGAGGIVALVLLSMFICCCCCCLIAYKLCRSAFDCILPQDGNKYQEGHYRDDSQQQQYPMQQYADPNQHNYAQQQSYPPQQQYPPTQGYATNQYPPNQPYPHHQGGYPNAYPQQPTY